jgi:hypothetical protein
MAEEQKLFQVLYDYDDVPTIRRFALDNTRIRCLMGPFGSGKSSGCVMEDIRRAHEQTPGPDGIRRTRSVVVRNCYDDQTEILTEKRGWQLFKDLKEYDRIASLVDDKELVFVYPTMRYISPYKGEMIGYRNQSIDFLVTPDHHLYASQRDSRNKKLVRYKLHKACDIYGSTNYMFKVNADEYETGETQYSEKMFEFFGFWFAEGCAGKYPKENKNGTIGYRWHLIVSQSENESYVETLLKDCDFKYSKISTGTCFNYSIKKSDEIKVLIEKLLPCGKSTTKYLPEWIKCAPRRHLKAFLYGYEIGDGFTRTDTNGSNRLYTSSEKLANDLQEIILKAGGSASFHRNSCTGGTIPNQGYRFILNLRQPSQFHPFSRPMKTKVPVGWYKQEYDGMIYCVEVPSHVIVTRRNKKILMNSQSYGQLKDTTIKTFCDWFPPRIFGEFRVTDHCYLFTKFPGIHHEVLFRALDRPDQVSNLLSLEVTWAWFNEIREIPWTIIEAMDSRIGRYPSKRDGGASWLGMFGDTNPPDDGSTLYRVAEVLKPDNFKMFKQPSGLSTHAENTKHLPKNYYQNLAKGKDEMYIQIYIHGQYGYLVSGKPVFQSFRDNIHVAPHVLEPMKGVDVLIGCDFGLQPAVTIGQLTPLGQLRILDELVSDGMGIRQFCENQLLPLLRQKYFGMNIMGFGDPSGISRAPTDESTCFDILHSQEIGLSNIVSAPTNAITPRVGAVEFFLNKMYAGEPGFVLSPNCHFIRKAMNGAYHYDKDPKGSGEEYKPMPVKNFASHVADSLEYLCMYVVEKESYDKQRKSFLASLKRKDYHPASEVAGY